MLKPILLRLVAVAAGVVLALLVLEVALRVLPQRPPPAGGALDIPHTSGYHEPDFRQRRYDLRQLERDDPGAPHRIVVIGDSFTWGARMHEEDAYPDRMQVRLARRLGPDRVEVINFSRPGWNTARELNAVRRWMQSLQPDTLVLGYCLNDADPVSHEVLARLMVGTEARKPAGVVSRAVHRHSRAYRLLYDKLENLRRRRALVRYYHAIYKYEDGLQMMRASLAGFRDLAAAHHIPFLVVLFPIFDSQLDWRYKYDGLHRQMRQEAEALGIDLLDLLPAYRGIDARRLAVEPFVDAHPSELAHRIAADAILDRLFARGVLPPAEEARP